MNTNNTITFKEGFEEYILNCKARNLRAGTIKHYNDSIKQIFKYIDPDMPIGEMDKNTVSNFIVELRDNEAISSDVSLYTYSRDLKTLMYFFMEQGYLPHFKIQLAKADKKPTETYTDAELQKLLKKPNLKQCSFTEYKAWVMVNFLLSTGVRQHSPINIKIKDLDFDNNVVAINVTKNRKPLLIPLNRNIVKILQEYLRYREGQPEDYLFCNVYGQQLVKSTVYHEMWQYNKDRGVEKTGMHRFRHTFAKKWVMMGGNVVTLQKILGHSSLEITQNYLNVLTCDIAKDVDEFNILAEFKKDSIKMK